MGGSRQSGHRRYRNHTEAQLTRRRGEINGGLIGQTLGGYQLAFHWLVSDDAQRENRSKKFVPLRFASPGY
jgi:hypothetical protein